MSYAQYIKEIGRGAEGARDLSRDDAQQIYAAMLDGGVPDLEMGAIILGLRVKGESLDEMLGFLDATDERTHRLDMPHGRVRPVVLPTYNGSRKEANLTPLLALLLQRFGRTVSHGMLLYSVLCGFLNQQFPGAIQVSQSFTFRAPTYADEPSTLQVTVLEQLPDNQVRLGVVMARLDGTVTVEGETVVKSTED